MPVPWTHERCQENHGLVLATGKRAIRRAMKEEGQMLLIFIGSCLILYAGFGIWVYFYRRTNIDTEVAEFAKWLETITPSDFERRGDTRV